MASPLPKSIQLAAGFRPLPLLANRHVQTLLGRYWPVRGAAVPAEPHVVELPDGDRLSVVCSEPPGWQADRATVVMLHGLGGCSESKYMVRIAGRLFERGLRVVRVNLRGCGSGAGLARLPYHAGRSDDLHHVLLWLAERTAAGPRLLVGFSLGGNIVLKYAGECGDAERRLLRGVAAVCPPIDLPASSRLIGLRRNRMYERYFVWRLVQSVRGLTRYFPDLPLPPLPRRLSLRQFDDLYTAPRAGFRNVHDYYERASAAPLVPAIRVPVLILASYDDPFVPADPIARLPATPSLDIRLTSHGGHMGFLGFHGPDRAIHWMDTQVVEWLAARAGSPSG
jgi:hypothetical protein